MLGARVHVRCEILKTKEKKQKVAQDVNSAEHIGAQLPCERSTAILYAPIDNSAEAFTTLIIAQVICFLLARSFRKAPAALRSLLHWMTHRDPAAPLAPVLLQVV